MRDSLIFYASFAKAIKRLPDAEQIKALWAIIDYGLCDKEPEDDGGTYMSIFDMAKPQIDANIKRKADGAKGGRPAKHTYAEENSGYEEEKPVVTKKKKEAKPKGFSRTQNSARKIGQQKKQNAFCNFEDRGTDYDDLVNNSVKEWIGGDA